MRRGSTASNMAAKRHILITGPPGIGKTTLCRKVYEVLSGKSFDVQGFYTEEVRSSTKSGRLGFDVVTLDGKRCPLARIKETGSGRRGPTVGNYIVDVQSFEKLAIPTIRYNSAQKDTQSIVIVDEIGKMELFSQPFTQAVRELFASLQVNVLATVPVVRQRPIQFVEQLKERSDVNLIEVTKVNRDALVSEVVEMILTVTKQPR